MTVTDDNYCFACGQNNPHGLKLTFRYDPEKQEVVSRAIFPAHFQGWKDVLHGGIVSTVLDEIMAKTVEFQGFKGVTADLKVKFKKPAYTGTKYTITGRINENRGKLFFTEASIVDEENTLIANAEARFFKVS